MSKSLFFKRLEQIPGARLDRKDAGGKDVTNIAVRPQSEWSSGDSAASLREILFPGWTPPGTEPAEPLTGAVAETATGNVRPLADARRKYVGKTATTNKYWRS